MLLCGCVSTKQVKNQSLQIAKFDIERFNGNYANKGDSAKHLSHCKMLFEQLFPTTFPNEYPKIDNPITDNTVINFHFDGEKILIVTAIENGEIVGKIKMRGKIRGNYFSANRKLFLIPIPILCYFHEETKILLGNDKMGRLVLKIGNFGAGWVLMAASSEYISQSQFKKLK